MGQTQQLEEPLERLPTAGLLAFMGCLDENLETVRGPCKEDPSHHWDLVRDAERACTC